MLYILINLLVNSSILTVYIEEYWIINVQGIMRIGDCIYNYMTVARTEEREGCRRKQLLKNNYQ